MWRPKIKIRNINDEEGFASIVVALVLILVLCLITVGFAQLMNSNEQSALNKQLSSQAYYAAESGVNDAAEAYAAGYMTPKTTCAPISGSASPGAQYLSQSNGQSTINSNINSSISCLLTDPTPPSINYVVTSTQPVVVEMQGCSTATTNPLASCGSGSASNIGQISINWHDKTGTAGEASNGCPSLYPETDPTSQWSSQNMLRIELIPIGNGTITRSSLINNAYTAYLCPDGQAASSFAYPTNNLGMSSGEMLSSHCDTSTAPETCQTNLDVSNMTGGPYSTFFLVMRSIYANPVVPTITLQDTSGNSLNIGDAQLLVDSTGTAQNVAKRIVVRVSETNEYDLPDAVVHGEICKQLELTPDIFSASDISPCGQNGGIRTQLQTVP